MTLEDRETKFRDLLKSRFAVRTIGQYVLGIHWRKASEEQREEYLELFAEWLVKTYAVRFGGYTDERFVIIGTRDIEGDSDVFVSTRIDKPGSSLVYKADWRVRDEKGELRIIDVTVEGLSMAVTQRSEFSSVARKSGIDGLIQTLRDNIARLDEESS